MFPIETISAKMLDYYVGRSDTLIIDVRKPDAYRKSHILAPSISPIRNYPYAKNFRPKNFLYFTVKGAAPVRQQLVFFYEKGTVPVL